MKHPITDKDLGIPHHFDSMRDKFRDVRKKAKLDEEERRRKVRRDKKEKVRIPKYKIGDEVVLGGGSYRSRHYQLAEVIDFEEDYRGDFSYYGIVKKTTDPEKFCRIGRLIKFGEHTWWSSSYEPANVENKGIKWLITPAIRLNGFDAESVT